MSSFLAASFASFSASSFSFKDCCQSKLYINIQFLPHKEPCIHGKGQSLNSGRKRFMYNLKILGNKRMNCVMEYSDLMVNLVVYVVTTRH
jgi:hypothetical protein